MEIRPRIDKAETFINKHKLASVVALGMSVLAADMLTGIGNEAPYVGQECVYRPGVKQSVRARFYTRVTPKETWVRKNDYVDGYSFHAIIRNGTYHAWAKRGDKVLDARKMPSAYNGLPEFFNLDKQHLECREWDISEKNFDVPTNIKFKEASGEPMKYEYNILKLK